MKERQFDDFSAMYHLLSDRGRRHVRGTGCGKEHAPRASIIPKTLPKASQSERKSSITTGTGAFSLHTAFLFYNNDNRENRSRNLYLSVACSQIALVCR